MSKFVRPSLDHVFDATPGLREVFEFVKNAHGKQKYGNKPYSEHLLDTLHFADLFFYHMRGSALDTEVIRTTVFRAALAHDVLEDTDTRAHELVAEIGYDAFIVVEAVTKDPSLDYAANIQNILDCQHIAPLIVKLADSSANYQRSMEIGNAKWAAKYKKNIELLFEEIDQRFPEDK